VLERDIADQPENYTRMMIVAREARPCPRDVPCKTSLVFGAKHEKGALARCIDVFADHDLNLTKLESRPKPRSPFEYVFYLDFEGHRDAPEVVAALEELGEHTTLLEILGSYPSRTWDLQPK
jgi:chorismate mutase/prephenate dehydratase